jgi:hypothetical protein
MSNNIFVPAYWPLFKTHELRRFDYVSEDSTVPPFTSVFSYDVGSDSMLYNNYDSAGTWLNKWFYQYRTGFGLAEWRDDYPDGKKIVLNPPIGWGEMERIGGTYINYPKFDFFRSWPPATGYGAQIVAFEEEISQMSVLGVYYQDVLKFSYLQSWGDKPSTGARYWMALGVGPIATTFLAQDPKDPKVITETPRWNARITRVNA